MRFCTTAVGAAVLSTVATAFAPAHTHAPRAQHATPLLSKKDASDFDPAFLRTFEFEDLTRTVRGAAAAAALAAAVWTLPASLIGPTFVDGQVNGNAIFSSVVASAKEQASGSGSRVNKDPESLLRLGLPIKNKEVRKVQAQIEDARYNIASKRKTAAIDNVRKTRTALNSQADKLASSCREPKVCSEIIKSMIDDLDPLEKSVKESVDYLQGSDQERAALDKAYALQTQVSKKLTDLEEQMVPKGYVTPVPEEYSDLPQLKGRATVEMVLKKADGGPFDVEGTNYPQAKMVMIIDGYTSPVTGGNFVDLVQKGFYDKMQIQRSDGFVVQTGDPDGEAEGYVGTPSKSVGKGKHGERLIPLEVFIKGDEGPFYGTTMEDEGRGGQATVLPFSSYGAMGWARDEYEADSGSSQFFWLLFDSDLTPAGKNVLDGRYPCFGYVVEGADFLRDTKEGDIIVSAKVTEGADKLVQPK